MRTYVAKGREAEALTVGKNWFVVDAKGQVLGRLATRVARLLIGKDKPSYTPSLDCGDHVIVINAETIRLTGNKIDQKVYRHHSGWPGGLKEVPIRALLQRRPEEVVREAVLGMLPRRSCVSMPEVKRLPATPDRTPSPSHCKRVERLQ
jgi:large subunit ribosomal protein L13